jgi:hypothetical protein
MRRARRVTLSAAVFVRFFLPRVEIGCGGFKDAESGFDIAQGGNHALWLVPLLMLAVFFRV